MQSLIGNNRRADISFFPNGRIDISARLSRLLSLQSGDTIDIKFDGYEYYIYVRNRSPLGGRFEAQCFPSNKKGRHFRAYSRRLYAAVSRACHCRRLLVHCRWRGAHYLRHYLCITHNSRLS